MIKLEIPCVNAAISPTFKPFSALMQKDQDPQSKQANMADRTL